MRVLQVPPHDRWPSGDSRALVELRFDPGDLTARYGLTFLEEYDDLDWFLLAAIGLADGSQAWLIKYRGEQETGTTVYVDAAADFPTTLALLRRTLDLRDEDVTWVAPALAVPAASV